MIQKLFFIIFLAVLTTSFAQAQIIFDVPIGLGETIQISHANKKEKKETIFLHLSMPTINSLSMTPKNENTKVGIGILGLTIGLDSRHSNNQFIHTGISFLSGGFRTSKKSDLLLGTIRERELMNSIYVSFSNNHKIGRFSTGYGLSFARNTWEYRETTYFWFGIIPLPVEKEDIKKTHYAFGFIFPTYYQIVKFLRVGIVYRPTFYRPNMTNKFVYEHLISIDSAFKLRLN